MTILAGDGHGNLLRVPDRRTIAGRRDYALLRVPGDCGLLSAELRGLRARPSATFEVKVLTWLELSDPITTIGLNEACNQITTSNTNASTVLGNARPGCLGAAAKISIDSLKQAAEAQCNKITAQWRRRTPPARYNASALRFQGAPRPAGSHRPGSPGLNSRNTRNERSDRRAE